MSIADRQAVQIGGLRSNTSERAEGARYLELRRWLSSTIIAAEDRTDRLTSSSSAVTSLPRRERWLRLIGLEFAGAFVVQFFKTLAGMSARDPSRC